MLVLVHLTRNVLDVGFDGAAGECHGDTLEAELADGQVVVRELAEGNADYLFSVLATRWACDGEDVGDAHVSG